MSRSPITFAGIQLPSFLNPLAPSGPATKPEPGTSPTGTTGLQPRAGSLAGAPRNGNLLVGLPTQAAGPPGIAPFTGMAGRAGGQPDKLGMGNSRSALGLDPARLRSTEVMARATSLENVAMLKIDVLTLKEDVDAAHLKEKKNCLARGDTAGAQRASQAAGELTTEMDDAFRFLKDTEQRLVATERSSAPPTHKGVALSAAAQSEMAKAKPLDQAISAIWLGADKAVWASIQEQDPVGAKCLSRMLDNAVPHIQNAHPEMAKLYGGNLKGNLRRMQEGFNLGKPEFGERVFAKAVANLGVEDRAILTPLFHHDVAEPLGFIAHQDLHIPSTDGVCHRVAPKWAAGKVAGASIKSEGMNIDKVAKKHQAYGEANRAAATQAWNESGQSPQAVDKAQEQVRFESIANTVGNFTDASGTKHSGEVAAGPLLPTTPSDHLSRSPLKHDEALIVSFSFKDPAKPGSYGAHTMAISGADLQLFDSGTSTIYDFKGTDIGKAVEQFADMRKDEPGHSVTWEVTPVRAVRPQDAPMSDAVRAEMENAPPLDTSVASIFRRSPMDKAAWSAIQKYDPAGAQCLSAMIRNANAHVKELGRTDMFAGIELGSNLHQTLTRMQNEFKSGSTSFTDQMLAMAKTKAGTDDKALLEEQPKS